MDLRILNGYVLGLIGLFSVCLYILVIAALCHDFRTRRSKASRHTANLRLGPEGQQEVVPGIEPGDRVGANAPDLHKAIGRRSR